MTPWRILIVDDDRLTVALLSRAMNDLGVIEIAGNGHEALQRLHEEMPPNLILLDAMMPGLSGFEVCAQLKAEPKLAHIPIIFVTGQSDQETETNALNAGAVDFISKPISLPVVKARVRTQLALLSQKRALEERIAAQSSEIEVLLNSIADPIWLKSADGVFLTVNPAALRAFDRSELEMIGHTVHDVCTPEIAIQAEIEDRTVIARGTQQSFEKETRSPDGTQLLYWEITKIPVTLGDSQPTGILAIARDVTFRKKTDQQLRMLSLAIEQNPNAIIITDSESRIEYVNDAFVRTTGYALDQTIGKKTGFFASGKTPPITFTEMKGALAAGKAWSGRFYNRTRDGADLINFAHVSPIRDADGKVAHYLSIQEDITERVHLAAEVSRTRAAMEIAEAANQAKSSFLANMSHEIRTPMNGIMGMAQLLLMPDLSESDRLDYANTLLDSSRTLLKLLNDILDLAKIESGRIQLESIEMTPSHFMGQTCELFAQIATDKGIGIECSWIGPSNHYLGDPYRLTQMLSNLVGNAIKFTEHGMVNVEGREISRDAQGIMLEFSVSDTGIGIARNNLDLLFQTFSQTDSSITRHYGGSGLGLSIVRSLAQAMGGDVGVHSESGMGSRFWFHVRVLPIDAESDANPLTQPMPLFVMQTLTQLSGRVLVAEDNPENQKVILGMLHKLGVAVDMVENGQHALDTVEHGAPYDLILMDLHMPVFSGYEVTRQIRQWESKLARPNLPIVALTADAFTEDRMHCKEAGMDDVLTKPIELSALHAMLSRWLPERATDVAQTMVPKGNAVAIDRAQVQELLNEALPLLALNEFSAIAVFRRLQETVSGAPLAENLDNTAAHLRDFRFDLALLSLREFAAQNGWTMEL